VPPSGDESPIAQGLNPLVYELFVLGELMVQPLYGYQLREIADRILGPLQPLSWGIVYPLVRRLEREGMATSKVEERKAGFPRASRGQPRRIYSITPAGQARFMSLMLMLGEYGRDTYKIFLIKFTKFQFLTSAQRLAILNWYRGFLTGLRDYYQTAREEVARNPEMVDAEKSWIVQLTEYQLVRFGAELGWLEKQIAACPQ